MNEQQSKCFHSVRCRVPPPSLPVVKNCLNSEISSSLPETFISSLRQLFSILDKTNCGYVPFDVFKRYFDCSTSTADFLSELEIESKSNNYLITFPLLINVIERSLLTTKHPPSILIPKATRSSISLPLDRSKDVLFVTPKTNQTERQIPIVYRNSNNISNPVYYVKQSHQNPEIDFPMIRSLQRFEIERNLLIQTCDTLERVKHYLTDRLFDMKDKQKSYCRYLRTAEATGLAPESIYNRDLIADLFKLANAVIKDVNYDFKKLPDRSSSVNGINDQYEKQLKAKDNHIKQLETEKRVLLKELIEMRDQQGTVIPIQIS